MLREQGYQQYGVPSQFLPFPKAHPVHHARHSGMCSLSHCCRTRVPAYLITATTMQTPCNPVHASTWPHAAHAAPLLMPSPTACSSAGPIRATHTQPRFNKNDAMQFPARLCSPTSSMPFVSHTSTYFPLCFYFLFLKSPLSHWFQPRACPLPLATVAPNLATIRRTEIKLQRHTWQSAAPASQGWPPPPRPPWPHPSTLGTSAWR